MTDQRRWAEVIAGRGRSSWAVAGFRRSVSVRDVCGRLAYKSRSICQHSIASIGRSVRLIDRPPRSTDARSSSHNRCGWPNAVFIPPPSSTAVLHLTSPMRYHLADSNPQPVQFYIRGQCANCRHGDHLVEVPQWCIALSVKPNS